MSREDLKLYDSLAASVEEKAHALGPYQQADCTAEFKAHTDRVYGGDLLGMNVVAKCNGTSSGPAIHLFDRVLTERMGHGDFPLRVATIKGGGFHVVQQTVLAEWMLRRVVSGGRMALEGLRPGAEHFPLQPTLTEAEAHALLLNITLQRVSIGAGTYMPGLGSVLAASPEETISRFNQIAELSEALGGGSDALDVAELFGAEKRIEAYQMPTHPLVEKLGRLATIESYDLELPTDGLWAVVESMGGTAARSEAFLNTDPVEAMVELENDRFLGMSGRRTIVPVGARFTKLQKEGLEQLGKGLNAKQTTLYGAQYGTPYTVKDTPIPQGKILRGNFSGKSGSFNYRVHVPAA